MDSSSINTLFTGKFLIKLSEIDSTNNFLKNWLSNNAPTDGTVILAEHQTAGRGQAGTSWQSMPGENITMSLLYQPKFILAKDQFVLSAMVACSVYELLSEFFSSHRVEIKWPNDIMIDKQKICGVLIENSIQGSHLQNSIIGIGLNVLQKNFQDLNTATSMHLKGYEGDTGRVLKRLLELLEKNYLLLKAGRGDVILEQYHQVLLGKGEIRKFSDHQSEFYGIIQGVAPDGRLEISSGDGNRFFYHKEVVFLEL